MTAIDVRGLRKTYRGHEAVRGIDLTVARGEVFALLGPNGAGKTTTTEILEGHRRRDGGGGGSGHGRPAVAGPDRDRPAGHRRRRRPDGVRDGAARRRPLPRPAPG